MKCNRHVILFIVFLFIQAKLYAQAPFINFFGDSISLNALTLIPFQDSSIFHAGTVNVPGAELRDSYFAMTDNIGNVEWIKRFNIGVNERIREVTTDGSFLYCLVYASNVYNTHLVKLAPNGSTVWSYRFLGEFPNTDLQAIKAVSDGLICTGITKVDDYHAEFVVVKLDFNGNVMWSSRYTPDFEPASEFIFNINEITNGDLIISGNTNSFDIGVPGPFGFILPAGYITRLSATGEFMWSVGCLYTHLIRDAFETSTNEIIAFGEDGDERPIIMKFSSEGDLIWIKKLEQEFPLDLVRLGCGIETFDHNLVLYGGSEYLEDYVPLLLKIDTDGNLLWKKEFNVMLNYQPLGEIFETSDLGLVGEIPVKSGYNGLFGTLKTDADGNNPCAAELINYELVPREDFITVDLNFARSGFIYNRSLASTGYFIDLDTSGFFCCDSAITEIFHENSGYAYTFSGPPGGLATYYWIIEGDTLYGHTVDYSFLGPGTYEICQYADNVCNQDSLCETIVVELDDSGLAEKDWNNRMQIYPNPAREEVMIKLNDIHYLSTLKIYSLSGKLVYENGLFTGQEILLLKDLPSGVYIIKIETENAEIFVRKLMRS